MDNADGLRNAMGANTVFSAASGFTLALAAGPIAEFCDIAEVIVRVVGVALTGWAAMLWHFTRRVELRRSEVVAVITGDVAWVIGTVAVLVAAPDALSDGGRMALGATGIIVAGFAAVQTAGVRRLNVPA